MTRRRKAHDRICRYAQRRVRQYTGPRIAVEVNAQGLVVGGVQVYVPPGAHKPARRELLRLAMRQARIAIERLEPTHKPLDGLPPWHIHRFAYMGETLMFTVPTEHVRTRQRWHARLQSRTPALVQLRCYSPTPGVDGSYKLRERWSADLDPTGIHTHDVVVGHADRLVITLLVVVAGWIDLELAVLRSVPTAHHESCCPQEMVQPGRELPFRQRSRKVLPFVQADPGVQQGAYRIGAASGSARSPDRLDSVLPWLPASSDAGTGGAAPDATYPHITNASSTDPKSEPSE